MIYVRLNELLRSRGLSQRELARRTGTHPDVISKFARQATGGVTYELLDRICSELGCAPGQLLVHEPDSPDQVTMPIWAASGAPDRESVKPSQNTELTGSDPRKERLST